MQKHGIHCVNAAAFPGFERESPASIATRIDELLLVLENLASSRYRRFANENAVPMDPRDDSGKEKRSSEQAGEAFPSINPTVHRIDHD